MPFRLEQYTVPQKDQPGGHLLRYTLPHLLIPFSFLFPPLFINNFYDVSFSSFAIIT